MDERLVKIEKEMALALHTLASVAKTLDKMSDMQVDTKLLEEKLNHLDRDLQESFRRVHDRIDEEASFRKWVTRIVLGTVLVAVLGVTLHLPKV